MLIMLILTPVSFLHGTAGDTINRPFVIAHRGASGLAPENTMPAIDSALAAGADYIEIDVQLSTDKALMVIHDRSVNRTTNGKGKIGDMSAAQIRELDAGSWFGSEFAGTKVPFLYEVIERIDGNAKLLIEIKKKGKADDGLEEAVVKTIRDHNAAAWCEIQSFNDNVLEKIHQQDPSIPLHKLILFKYRCFAYAFDGKISRFDMEKYDYVKNINLHYRFFNKAFCDEVKSHGKGVFIWGYRKQDACFPAEKTGYDGIITDYPASFLERFVDNTDCR